MDGGASIFAEIICLSLKNTSWFSPETFKVMQRRLLKTIMTPAMIASFVFGFWLISLNHGLIYEIWFQIKFIAVFLMAGVHGKFAKMHRLLENDEKPLSSNSYRVWNEVPTFLMIIIIVMAVVKPVKIQ